MELKKCPECGKEINKQAKNCPNCGNPLNNIKKQKKNTKTLSSKSIKIIIAIVVIIVLCIIGIIIYNKLTYIETKGYIWNGLNKTEITTDELCNLSSSEKKNLRVTVIGRVPNEPNKLNKGFVWVWIDNWKLEIPYTIANSSRIKKGDVLEVNGILEEEKEDCDAAFIKKWASVKAKSVVIK